MFLEVFGVLVFGFYVFAKCCSYCLNVLVELAGAFAYIF